MTNLSIFSVKRTSLKLRIKVQKIIITLTKVFVKFDKFEIVHLFREIVWKTGICYILQNTKKAIIRIYFLT